MLSLANSYSEDEIRDFDRRVRELLDMEIPAYVTELKFDGVAIGLTYRGPWKDLTRRNRVCSIITGDHAAFRLARAVCRVTVVRSRC